MLRFLLFVLFAASTSYARNCNTIYNDAVVAVRKINSSIKGKTCISIAEHSKISAYNTVIAGYKTQLKKQKCKKTVPNTRKIPKICCNEVYDLVLKFARLINKIHEKFCISTSEKRKVVAYQQSFSKYVLLLKRLKCKQKVPLLLRTPTICVKPKSPPPFPPPSPPPFPPPFPPPSPPDPQCSVFDVDIGNKYKIRPNLVASSLTVRATLPRDTDQCILNNNNDGCCLTNGKYLSMHAEIVDSLQPQQGESGEATYITTFASPVSIAKYTTIYGFQIKNTTPTSFQYEICYKSEDPLSGPVTPETLIMSTYVKNIRNAGYDADSIIGTECAICPQNTTILAAGSPPPTFCGPPLLWDAWSNRPTVFNGTNQKDCYPMISPSPLVMLPICPEGGNVTTLLRYRSYACRETSDTGYRASISVKQISSSVEVNTCYAGTGQR